MEIKDWINILAILSAPIVAVQIQKWLERSREKISRKIQLFKTLMSTRASRMSPSHVQALNLIDVEFNETKYEPVVTAWRTYLDHLSHDSNRTGWSEKNDELFIELLYQMGYSLDYNFDKVMLKRTSYIPVGHADIETEQQIIRQGFAKIFSDKSAFPVFFVNEKTNEHIK